VRLKWIYFLSGFIAVMLIPALAQAQITLPNINLGFKTVKNGK
jgi:hypothetical protein